MSYKRLTPLDRYQIDILRRSNFSINAIARKIERSPSTVSRELKRLGDEYEPEVAQILAYSLASARREGNCKIKGRIKKRIHHAIAKRQWSPEQIAEQLRDKDHVKPVSHQTIYRYIRKHKFKYPELWLNLRLLRKKRKDRQRPKWRPHKEAQQVRISIEKRPKIVEKRKRLGDVERDIVHGKAKGALLLTIVDRVSRRVKIEKIKARTNEEVHRATVRALRWENVKTITNDNGGEFRTYKPTMEALNTIVYFSRAYRSWERGTNENTNGLIRQYFPRYKDLTHVSNKEIKRVERLLNNRPRKCLDFKTPNQVHAELNRLSKALR